MVDPRRRGLRLSKPQVLWVAVFLAGMSLVAPVTAVADGHRAGTTHEPLQSPGGFTFKASNGYAINGFVLENPKDGSGVLFLSVRRNGAWVTYTTRATATATSIEADLGKLGAIDIHFVPSGGTTTERSNCGGRPVTFASGEYVGRVDFEGENHYTQAHATHVGGEVRELLSFLCVETGSEGTGGHAPGARLIAHYGRSKTSVVFTARKNLPTGRAAFMASITERRDAMYISRGIEASGAAGAFTYDVPAGIAEVHPPAPFVGGASFRRGPRSARLTGDLSVDFPGRSAVRLAGKGTHSSLVRSEKSPLFG